MVVILTEAGNQYGYGHLMRCLAVAQSFQKRGIESAFYLRGNPDVKEILKGFKCHNFDWLIRPVDVRGKIVILDSYCADRDFCKKVYKEAKTVLFVDDYNRIAYPGGLVLNSTIAYEDIDYPDNPKVTYLLGPKYHPLRREFWKVPKKEIRESVKKVLITTGGSDLANLIPKIIKVLKEKYRDLEKNIIVGKEFLNIDEIRSEADKKTNLIYYPDAKRMKKEMLETDICISAGGQTIYELARLGVPAVGICFAQNQRMNLERGQIEGIIEYAGWHNDRDLIEKILKKFDNMHSYIRRKALSRIGKSCIDGAGADRLTQIIQEKALLESSKDMAFLKIRDIKMDDCRDIWRWRNNPEVRKMCYETKSIRYSEHRKWFNSKISNVSTGFFIVENGDKQKIGQVRFEKNGKNSSCININLNPDFFGKGLGGKIIKYATRYFMNKFPEVKDITAEIIEGNIVSEKAFKKAGYEFHKHTTLKGRKTSIFKFRKT
jgi:UDP-2,4-diacetamido-2,4,6-trideoxy-beta-L-altropyranose hydrolase